MIIERFKDNDMLPIYQRIRDEGRMFPEGLKYIDSWVEPNFSRCFQHPIDLQTDSSMVSPLKSKAI
jgi:hypothetical protein